MFASDVKAAWGRFPVGLSDAEGVKTTPQKYVISDLPANCTVAIAFAQKDERKEEDYVLISPHKSLGIDEWTSEWKVLGKQPAYSAVCGREDTAFVVNDPADAGRWLTKAGADYELHVQTRKTSGRPNGGNAGKETTRLVLIGVPMDELVLKPDTRPQRKRLVDHGRLFRKDIRVNHLGFKTPAGKYLLDLGDADGVEGICARFELLGLPSRYVLCIGFGLESADPLVLEATDHRLRLRKAERERIGHALLDELEKQTGIQRIHIHLATKDGHVLISDEFDTKKSFRGPALPLYGAARRYKCLCYSPGNKNWTFRANSADGCCFVAAEDATTCSK